MREVFGDGKLVKLGDGFGVEAIGLHAPALLLPGINGAAVPDLTAHVGTVISYAGSLRSAGDNLETIAFHGGDIQLPPEGADAPPISPMWAVVSGNLGKAPEPNPKGDRLVASIAYDKIGDATSWLRVTAYTYFSIADHFRVLEAGTGLITYGSVESYDYNGKPRAQLALRSYQHIARSGSAPKPPISLMSGRDASELAAHAFDDAA